MPPPPSLANLKTQAGVLVPIFCLLVLSFLQPFTDIFTGILKPIVIGILSLFGHDIVDGGSFIQVGNLNIGWSRDCTGINQFLLLLAMVIWMRRRNLWVRSTIYACLWAVPAALVANVARVLTIIGYRIWFFPEIESPELHYFIGFLWILPLVCLLLPSMERRNIRRWIEFAHALAVLALLAPLLGASEGLAMGAATAIILAKSQVPGIWTRRRLGLLAVWIGIGFAIASLRMESFWLPWLLISPLSAKKEWLRQPRAVLLLLCSHPLFDLIPGGNAITWLAVVWTLWKDFIKAPSTAAPGTSSNANTHISANLWWIRGSIALSLLMLTAPFTAALFLQNHLSPPHGLPKMPESS